MAIILDGVKLNASDKLNIDGTQVKKIIYENQTVWIPEKKITLTVSGAQKIESNAMWYETLHTNTENFDHMRIDSMTLGKSYGSCQTMVKVFRAGSLLKIMRQVNVLYTDNGYIQDELVPYTTVIDLLPMDEIYLYIRPIVDPNVWDPNIPYIVTSSMNITLY